MLNWKCIVPKTESGIKTRVKTIVIVALPIFMASAMFMAFLKFADNWWLGGASLGALSVMWAMWMRTPFGSSGRDELKEKVYEAKGEAHCGNPNLPSDEQLIADGEFMYHTSLMVGSIWLLMMTPVLFVKYLSSPILGW